MIYFTKVTESLIKTLTFSVGQLYCLIRSRIELASEDALFCIVNNTMLTMSQTMGEIYQVLYILILYKV